MFRPSAKVVILRARPSGPKSSRILTPSRGVVPSAAGNGYSSVSVTQSRPRSSKAMLSGLWISGSAATSSISNPSGRWNAFALLLRRPGRGRRDILGRAGGSAARSEAGTNDQSDEQQEGRRRMAVAGEYPGRHEQCRAIDGLHRVEPENRVIGVPSGS